MKRRFMICIAALLITLFCAVLLAACGEEEKAIDNDQPNESETLSFDENSSLSEIKAALAAADSYKIDSSLDYYDSEGNYLQTVSSTYCEGTSRKSVNVDYGGGEVITLAEVYTFSLNGLYYSYVDQGAIIYCEKSTYNINYDLDNVLYSLMENNDTVLVDNAFILQDYGTDYNIKDSYVKVAKDTIEFGYTLYEAQHNENGYTVENKLYELNESTDPIDISNVIGDIDKAVWADRVYYNGYEYAKTSIDGEECYVISGTTKDYVEGTLPETTINTLPVKPREN